jgi:hypothetical protein
VLSALLEQTRDVLNERCGAAVILAAKEPPHRQLQHRRLAGHRQIR